MRRSAKPRSLRRRYGRSLAQTASLRTQGDPLDIVIECAGAGFFVGRRDIRKQGLGGFKTHAQALEYAKEIAYGHRILDLTRCGREGA